MTTYLQSLQIALHELFATDPRVHLLGEDILDPYGGAFKVSKGLSSRFPGHVWTSPISEASLVGVGVGMALRGLRPIVEIMFGDFLALAADQILNHAAKFGAMYAGQVQVPLVIRTPMGGGRGYGPTHSQTLDKMFLGIPHLRVVAPSLFHDPGEMLRAAVLEDDGPVLFLEHKGLYSAPLTLNGPDLRVTLRPEPIGPYHAAIVRNYEDGDPDVTLLAYGGASLWVEPLMAKMIREEIRIVACLPGCISPSPVELLSDMVRESGRVVIVEEGSRAFGWGAEIAASLGERLWRALVAPIRRVAASDTIIPAAKPLEAATLPSHAMIETALLETLK